MSQCQNCKHFREKAASWYGDCLKHGTTTDPIAERPCFEMKSTMYTSISADVAKQFVDQMKQLLSGLAPNSSKSIPISIYCHCIFCDIPIAAPSFTNQFSQSMAVCPSCRAAFPVNGQDQPIYPTYLTCICCGNVCGGFHISIGTNPAVSQITCLNCHHMWLIG